MSKPVIIDDIIIEHCLKHRSRLVSRLPSFRLDSPRWEVTRLTNTSLSCTLILAASEDTKLHVALWRRGFLSECSEQNYVTVRDDGYSFNTTDCGRNFSVHVSSKNALELDIVVGEIHSTLNVTIVVQTVDAPFETKHITANMVPFNRSRVEGYIQTHSGGKEQPSTDSWVTISLPLDHVTLISILHFHLLRRAHYDYRSATVRLYKGGKSADDRVWRARGGTVPLPEVFHARLMYLRFTGKVGFLWFRLLYSFHEQIYKPFRVHGDFWNCSVPKWPEFQRHFRCNLDRECDGWEDEVQCSYSGYCGQGRLTLQDRCYVYIRAKRMSWRDSNLECQRQGGYLVSLNTLSEWEEVVAALRMRRSNKVLLVGLHQTPSVLPFLYRGTKMWADKTVAYFTLKRTIRFPQTNKCGYMYSDYSVYQKKICDYKLKFVNFLCELGSSSKKVGLNSKINYLDTQKSGIRMFFPGNDSLAVPSLKCPGGHLTHAFLACDEQSACWASRQGYVESEARGVPARPSCPAPIMSLPAMFACSSGMQHVPYSMVCDHRPQCADDSDESFCVFPPCSGSTPLQCAASAQCVSILALCNAKDDCPHGSDETQCIIPLAHSIHAPAVVNFKPRSRPPEGIPPYFMTEMTSSCPETHFQCPDDGYCLPMFVWCNGVNDCPGREDEAGCDRRSCPGFYRCRSSTVCLHPSHVCDARNQCPQHDDELFCRLTCPAGCTCHGLDFTCHQPFTAELYSSVRYLDASGSGLTLSHLRGYTFLVHLSLSRCGLGRVHNMMFPNLRSLDLSHNQLVAISTEHLIGMFSLQYMSLSNNPLQSLFPADKMQLRFPALRALDLSGVRMQTLTAGNLSCFPNIQTLNLSNCGIEQVNGEGFRTTNKLKVLNLAGCPMVQFPRDLFLGLDELQSVQADNFKLCCAATLPAVFNLANCRAPFDEVSSCESLLRANIYVVFLAMFCCLGLLGNFGCFMNRSLCSKSGTSGFGVFVTHLSASDLLMGVYLAIVGIADRLYKGSYLWQDLLWRHSVACKVAGFLSLLSNEVSALIICLITLDRFLVLRFPFSSLHFKARSAHVTCVVVWVLVMATAAVPLTPMTSHWSFYSQTGICIPLPVTRRNFAGRHYAFGVLIVCNFILFVLIAAGQAAIYLSIQANKLPTTDSTKKSTDLRIARRLISVALSDFLCWFPIGLLGLLANRRVPIPGEVNVGIAILVLPLNSALNPFLYTINVMLERRRRLHEERLLKQLMARMCEEGQKMNVA